MIFLDETKINMFSLDGRVWCWIHDPKEFLEWTIILSIKHDGDSIMIWGCMFINKPSLICRIESSLNHFGY